MLNDKGNTWSKRYISEPLKWVMSDAMSPNTFQASLQCFTHINLLNTYNNQTGGSIVHVSTGESLSAWSVLTQLAIEEARCAPSKPGCKS